MMKKLIIGLLASSSIFFAVPAFAATEAEVVDTCATSGQEACLAAIAAFLAATEEGARATAILNLATALSDKALTFDKGQRAVFTAALNELSSRPEAEGARATIANYVTSVETVEKTGAGGPEEVSTP